ncbi:hypothetical protein RV00_GL002632 [Enterococcus devriesei]|uniref:Uncharacterized protein n=1 Tax=Enterococcus devriesei TaxID=319970 RepID=A0A1L8STM3_9ENTE|nr:hypothetical protein RV00_GL002632 [Enterococcus devriesei]
MLLQIRLLADFIIARTEFERSIFYWKKVHCKIGYGVTIKTSMKM